jgi:hypothetical protein
MSSFFEETMRFEYWICETCNGSGNSGTCVIENDGDGSPDYADWLPCLDCNGAGCLMLENPWNQNDPKEPPLGAREGVF